MQCTVPVHFYARHFLILLLGFLTLYSNGEYISIHAQLQLGLLILFPWGELCCQLLADQVPH